jgi:predicted site-specific integrase-resolvase
MNDNQKLINAGSLGDLLNLRSTVILRWAKQGDIPSIRLPNGRYMFDENEVLSALKVQGNGSNTLLGGEGGFND